MSFLSLLVNEPGRSVLMTGNEAVARGAIEAGIGYASSYPGSPTAEILGNLGRLAGDYHFYAEWSVNEKVALEGAAAASFAGLRSICIMKPNGVNVALDSLASISQSGIKAGLVLVVGDDPAGHSSTNEEDSRYLEKLAHMPILEPSTPREAKEMTLAAFELSEKIKLPVALRCVTRVCHASGNVTVGEIAGVNRKPAIGKNERFITVKFLHALQEAKLNQVRRMADAWPFNRYAGPENAKTLVITAGASFMYAREAVKELGLEGEVGILKLGISWPLPEKTLLGRLKTAEKAVFIEEVEPFIEENVMHLAAQHMMDLYPLQFYGQKSGHVAGPSGPGIGEMNPEIVAMALAAVCGVNYSPPPGCDESVKKLVPKVPQRDLAFCAGCPHRASFWAVKSALALDGRDGVVLGDIGCYTMGVGRTGFNLLQTVHAMGSGVGMACGLGKLADYGFNQPVVAMVGDSTFYHAAIPALVNARYNKSSFLLVVLDNETTAMTGHQPHPGMGKNAMGEEVVRMPVESVAEGLGIPVSVHDPYDVEGTTELVFHLLQSEGTKVLVLRRACALIAAKGTKKPRVYVDQELCIGDSCGCNRFCNQTFSCTANIWDVKNNKAVIDEVVCNRCQVCVSLCPRGAIKVEGGEQIG
ncbi:indolepyruvate ferredoxin oxidoreductase [Desulfallas sp. Bu1-1]|uniref:thiamine pyrophosphate-dependent enzyme n=1 Tax=Desulfallas sp. Bu1-1 TaxID=2787620 RepID=UPI00189DC92D|nr:thiamine pyrophosphate-dependent enzyme [Desulfallas sp. Bu1-1]MBF7082730.1 indolepyruvate ferredoxin oxidoreductase [Desulfallas sp. Bu1-1]